MSVVQSEFVEPNPQPIRCNNDFARNTEFKRNAMEFLARFVRVSGMVFYSVDRGMNADTHVFDRVCLKRMADTPVTSTSWTLFIRVGSPSRVPTSQRRTTSASGSTRPTTTQASFARWGIDTRLSCIYGMPDVSWPGCPCSEVLVTVTSRGKRSNFCRSPMDSLNSPTACCANSPVHRILLQYPNIGSFLFGSVMSSNSWHRVRAISTSPVRCSSASRP